MYWLKADSSVFYLRPVPRNTHTYICIYYNIGSNFSFVSTWFRLKIEAIIMSVFDHRWRRLANKINEWIKSRNYGALWDPISLLIIILFDHMMMMMIRRSATCLHIPRSVNWSEGVTEFSARDIWRSIPPIINTFQLMDQAISSDDLSGIYSGKPWIRSSSYRYTWCMVFVVK